jgi:hypothetical protein
MTRDDKGDIDRRGALHVKDLRESGEEACSNFVIDIRKHVMNRHAC